MNKTKYKFPAGATSLLVVVGLAMLLLVIVSGLTVLSIRESRQALNTDLSNRALAAASASAQDAAQLLNTSPTLQVNGCTGQNSEILNNTTGLTAKDLQTPTLSNSADNQTTIQCRTITSVAPTFTQELIKDKSSTFFTYLPSNAPISTMNLLWGDGASEINSFAATVFPSGWPSATPAAMELTLIYWPKVSGQPVGNITSTPADGLPVRTVILLPKSTSSDPSPNGANTISNVNCDGNKQGVLRTYTCSSQIDLLSIIGARGGGGNYNIVVKLKPRYVDSPIQVQFFSDPSTGSGNPVAIQSSIATIDVTAKVGDLYRRIQAQKPVGSNSFIDDVLYSNAKICKNLTVRQDYSIASENNCRDSY